MKQLNSLTAKELLRNGEFVYVKLNDNVNEALQYTDEDAEKSAQKMIREGRQAAMTELPEWANKLTNKIDKNKYLEKDSTAAENLVKDVKESVLNVIKKGENKTSEPLHKLSELTKDLEKGQNNAEATVGTIDFAVGNVGKLSESLMSKLNSMQQYKKELKEKKHFWEVNKGRKDHWYQFFKEKHSQSEVFTSRVNVVQESLQKLKGEVERRKTDAEASLTAYAKTASEEFDILSPGDQKKFLDQSKQEMDGTKNSLDKKFELGVMSSRSYEHRIEIYKKAELDQTPKDRNLLLSTAQFASESEKYAKSQTAFEGHRNGLTKLDALKTNFKKGIPENENIKSHNDQSGLIKELDTFFHEIYSDSNVKSELWAAYPDNYELTDLQKITAFLVKIGDGDGDPGSKITKSLRIKIVGYLDYLNTEENGEELGKYSPEFVKSEEVVTGQFKAAEELFSTQTDLQSKKTLNDILTSGKLDAGISKEIVDFYNNAELKIADFERTKGKLIPSEQRVLQKHFDSLKKIADASKKILETWQEEADIFTKSDKIYKDKIKSLEIKKEALKTAYTEKKIIQNKKGEEVGKQVFDVELERQKEYNHIVSELEIEKLKSPDATSAKFTKISTHIDFASASQSISLNTTEITDRTSSGNKRSNTINDNIKNFVERSAKNDDNEKSKAELQKHQEAMLNNLSAKILGSTVELSGVKYSSTGVAPSVAELTSKTPDKISNAVIWGKANDLVILKTSTQIIVVQKSAETQRVEMVAFEIGSITDKDKAIDAFREKQAQHKSEFIASPTSIMPF